MRLLTESEVSEILRCTKAALRRWRREERGPRFIRVGRLIRYRLTDVDQFLESNASAQRAKGQPETDLKAEDEPTRFSIEH